MTILWRPTARPTVRCPRNVLAHRLRRRATPSPPTRTRPARRPRSPARTRLLRAHTLDLARRPPPSPLGNSPPSNLAATSSVSASPRNPSVTCQFCSGVQRTSDPVRHAAATARARAPARLGQTATNSRVTPSSLPGVRSAACGGNQRLGQAADVRPGARSATTSPRPRPTASRRTGWRRRRCSTPSAGWRSPRPAARRRSRSARRSCRRGPATRRRRRPPPLTDPGGDRRPLRARHRAAAQAGRSRATCT